MSGLQFSMLGALAVRGPKGEITVAGARRRALVLRFLVAANHPVPAGRLAEDLWDGSPPAGAATTLHSYISRLRALVGADRITTEAGGYTLRVEEDELDAWVFETEATAGRTALRDRDPARADAVLARALNRWRGDALEDVAGAAWSQSEAARLEELRLGALEARVEALLAVGNHTGAAAVAEAAVREHPLRERVWALLMTALYRGGRQAEALAAYQRVRHHLGEELGLDPSPELAALEQAILLHKPDGSEPPNLSPVPTPVTTSASALAPDTVDGVTEPPSGTVTFLFSDVERSTENVALLGDERYVEVLEVHRDVLRRAFAAHHGHEVGTEGDSFFVAFARAGDGVKAATDGQLGLESADWPGVDRVRVRMGIHTAEAVLRAGDYFGHDVHRAKRIADAGHGGQILVSQATAELVHDGVSLADCGSHRLKDLGDPQRLYQVHAEGLRSEFPPLRSLAAFRHSLPLQRSSFVGREVEIAEVRELLADNRLVTVHGVGGCGKTRLALQVGVEVLECYPDGVFFVDLAQLADPDSVPATIAQAVGVALGTGLGTGLRATTDELLFSYLGHRTCLVILDNCEHLLDACADIADQLLGQCPDVTILATSREALDVDGERPWRVPSLSLPAGDDDQTSEAVALFKTRAHTARPDFKFTPENVGAVVEICRRLDGIPLAIEFAAARTAHLSPPEIAERLGDMFTLLSGGRRRRMQRQQTLRAALDWSYELLSDEERGLLLRLAAFPASFSLAAAEGICSGDGIETPTVLDLVGSLVAKSLVTIEDERGTTRYRLIETVRLYATEKLREAGAADTYRTRHRDWFVAWARSFDWDDLLSDSVFTGLASRIGAEQANLRGALEWSEDQSRFDLVLALAARMRVAWLVLGKVDEGLRWLTRVRPEDVDLTRDERVAALATAAMLTGMLQRPGAPDLSDRAVAAGEGIASAPLAWALAQRALDAAVQSQWHRDPELAEAARRDIAEATRMASGHPKTTHAILTERGAIELVLGDARAAADYYGEVPIFDRGPPLGLAGRAAAAHLVGDHQQAAAVAAIAVDVLRANQKSEFWLAGGLCSYAVAAAGADDIEAGKALLNDFVDAIRRSGRAGLVMALEQIRADMFEELLVGTAVIAHMTGDQPSAARLLAWVRSRTFDRGRNLPTQAGYALYRHYVARVRAALTRDEAQRYVEEGRAMSENDTLECARYVLAPDDLVPAPHVAASPHRSD